MNLYTFTGRIGKDSETRFTQSSMAICSFSVAVDYGYGDNKGTNWLRCSLFGKRAEGNLPQYLVKGAQVGISGELKIREYDDKDGNRRTSVEVNVNTLDLLGSKQDQGQQNQQSQQQPAQGPRQNTQQPYSPGQGIGQSNFPSRGGNQNNQQANPHDPFVGQQGQPVEYDIPF